MSTLFNVSLTENRLEVSVANYTCGLYWASMCLESQHLNHSSYYDAEDCEYSLDECYRVLNMVLELELKGGLVRLDGEMLRHLECGENKVVMGRSASYDTLRVYERNEVVEEIKGYNLGYQI